MRTLTLRLSGVVTVISSCERMRPSKGTAKPISTVLSFSGLKIASRFGMSHQIPQVFR